MPKLARNHFVVSRLASLSSTSKTVPEDRTEDPFSTLSTFNADRIFKDAFLATHNQERSRKAAQHDRAYLRTPPVCAPSGETPLSSPI
jgi:hypothetical protein